MCEESKSFLNDSTKLGVVPQPRVAEITGNAGFVLNARTNIVAGDGDELVAAYLQTELRRGTGYDMECLTVKPNRGNMILLELLDGAHDNPDAYRLEATPDAVRITAIKPQGLFWGVQTLLQLLPPEIYSAEPVAGVSWEIPAVRIEDEPLFTQFRGLHVDISRHFRTKDELCRIIDLMAYHKLNTMHLHLCDDEGWRLEIKQYPKLTEVGAVGDKSNLAEGPAQFLTQKDMREIIAHAKERFIQIFPEVDMPGHMLAVIRSYPELASVTDPRDEKRVIRIDEEGAAFCCNVLREIAQIFDAPYIHIGFDEVNLGVEDADIYDSEGITAFARDMTTFIKNELGKTPIVWDDAFEKGLHDPETLVQWWRYGRVHWWRDLAMTIEEKCQKLEQPFIISTARFTYFDMPHLEGGWAGPISVAQLYNWDPFEDMAGYDASKRHLAQGIIAASWSEGINTMEIFERQVFPRLATLSEKAWVDDAKTPRLPWEDYREKVLIEHQLKRYDSLGLNYWSKGNLEAIRNLSADKKSPL